MNRQATLEQIQSHLQQADDETLDNVLYMLEHAYPLDDWDRQMIADSKAGKFDKLIREVDESYYSGDVQPLADGLKHRG